MTRSCRASRAARACILGGIGLAGLACSSPTDPFSSGPGYASVRGQVTSAGGGAIPNTSVRIACPGVAAVVVATDSAGRYLSGLQASASSFTLTSSRITCRFSEPAEGIPRVQIDTALGFARGPVLVALQTVNLQER